MSRGEHCHPTLAVEEAEDQEDQDEEAEKEKQGS